MSQYKDFESLCNFTHAKKFKKWALKCSKIDVKSSLQF